MAQGRTQFEAIGTRWTIECELPAENLQEVFAQVHERIEQYDKHYSRFRSDSLVSRMAQNAGAYPMPEDWEKLWRVYETLYKLTDGAFTPLVGNLLEDLGYDAQYSLKQKSSLRATPRLEDAVRFEGSTMHMLKPELLDIGAGGKGYLIDIVAEILNESGAASYMIEAGGDIVHKGGRVLRVGLENPFDTTQAVGVGEIQNESICGSAGNRRRLGSDHHIVDPHTQHSPTDIAAVWVIAQSGLLADALSTALYFTSPEKLKGHFDFEWAVLSHDHSVRFSQRFANAFFA